MADSTATDEERVTALNNFIATVQDALRELKLAIRATSLSRALRELSAYAPQQPFALAPETLFDDDVLSDGYRSDSENESADEGETSSMTISPF